MKRVLATVSLVILGLAALAVIFLPNSIWRDWLGVIFVAAIASSILLFIAAPGKERQAARALRLLRKPVYFRRWLQKYAQISVGVYGEAPSLPLIQFLNEKIGLVGETRIEYPRKLIHFPDGSLLGVDGLPTWVSTVLTKSGQASRMEITGDRVLKNLRDWGIFQ